MTLPAPPAEALAHSERAAAHIRDEIGTRDGWISFARFMELALYAPGLGYYSAGARKLGPDGDFVTAPEMTPLFGETLARQVAQLFETGLDTVLEVGAGSGALAASMLAELERVGRLPRHYFILEVSADMRVRERDTLAARVPQLVERVVWLNQLPPAYEGVVIGNEVLDAMPVELIRVVESGVEHAGVTVSGERFDWAWRPAPESLAAEAARLGLPVGYTTEIGVVARAFVSTLARMLSRGVMLFLDYGFPEREFYHPQRAGGTLMCHFRHQSHADPFLHPGLQDITAHVNFTDVAQAGADAGLEVLGYTTQAHFLVNCGITDLLARVSPDDAARYLPLANAAQRLLSPGEMGELFKAIALGRGMDVPLRGFANGDRTDSL